MKSIIRVSKPERYAVLDHNMLRDARLSFAARGMLGYLLSRPENWQVQVSDLINQSPAGRDAVYAILRELEKHGYMRREEKRDASGRITHYETEVRELPTVQESVPVSGAETPETDAPLTGEPLTAFPFTANPPLRSNERKEVTKVRTHTNVCAAAQATAAPPSDNSAELPPTHKPPPRKLARAKRTTPDETPDETQSAVAEAKPTRAPAHPAVAACREETGRTPNHRQREEIIRAVGDAPEALTQWRERVREYARQGQPPHRVDWMLERFTGDSSPSPAVRQSKPVDDWKPAPVTPELAATAFGISVAEAARILSQGVQTQREAVQC